MGALAGLKTDLHEWGNREKNALVLNYTATCPLQCDFCCYGCSPQKKGKMPFDQAWKLISQISEEESFTSVAFTGGEPMLFPEEIVSLASAAKEIGKSSTLATAGHWADTQSVTDELIAELVSAGLNRLNVSHDPSHSEFVQIDNIRRIAKAAARQRIPLYVISTFYDRLELAEAPDLSDPVQGTFHYKKLVAKVGRGKPAAVDYGRVGNLDTFSCYRTYYHDLVVFYDGRTYPCCSTFNRASPGLALGNAFEEPLSVIIDRLLGSLLLRTIKRKNFSHFVEIVARYDEACADEIRAITIGGGACSFCNRIFKNRDLFERVYAAFERFERDTVADLRPVLSECVA